LLSVRALTRRFGEREVVRCLNLVAEPGDRITLHGPNGSGKTTVLRCIAGTVTPSSGTVSVLGQRAGSLAARRHMGVSLSQERSFYLRLSGRENLLFYARLRDLGKRTAIRAVRSLEEELQLTEILGTRVDRCSTGMTQQLAFARALLGDPELLLLDEPTRSLDEAAVDRFWGALDRRPASALVIATHNPADVARCGVVHEL
jgi:ABC-type multidrug transport system ATPase subunit